ncbi:aminopeptidase N [Kitasatospora sp. NPDC051853]|uniref:aminopeptidase N n=1 Tax=Kitasatospora sp. NPDC051853 TaxID=3364058 RepID=UPI003788B0AF
MPGENLTRDEARERARLLTVDGYRVALDLRSATDPEAGTFRSTTTLRFRCAEPGAGTFVDLIAPTVESVTLNGLALDPAVVFDGSRITLDQLAATNVLVVEAHCAYVHTGEGMHRFTDPQDGQVYLYTHHEPAGARRVFAAFEQPDLKSPFTFSVTAPAHWTVLGNQARAGTTTTPDGTTRHFAPTAPLPSYATVVTAGPYHAVTDHHGYALADGTVLDVPLSVLCRASLARHLDAAEILTVTKQGLDFFHERFGYPYPYGKYDQCFVPGFHVAAMENPGCVTLRDEFVFRTAVTEAAHEGRSNVILHEMAHMWFGNLVTMRWWDDLWLKESFADYAATLCQAEATRHTNAWSTFANHRKAWAYRADQLPSTHPVTAEVRDLRDATLNFDGITYAKGAAVLKQLVAHIGTDAFSEALRRYFGAHAHRNAGFADLLSALEHASGRELGPWADAWLRTAGVDVLSPRLADRDGTLTELTVVQENPGTHPRPRPHRTAVGLYGHTPHGTLERYARREIDLTDAHTSVPELTGGPVPALVLVNDDDLTYCKTRFDPRSLATVREHLGDMPDALARAQTWSALWNMTRDALLPAQDYLALVRRFAGRESDPAVVQTLHANAATALHHYVPPRRRPAERAALADQALRHLSAAQPGAGHPTLWAHFLVSNAGASRPGLLSGLLAGTSALDGLHVDQELRWALLFALTAHGAAGEEAVEAEHARDDTAAGARHRARCLAARPTAAAKAEAWTAVTRHDPLPLPLLEATISGFAHPDHHALLAPYTDRYFAALETIWSTHPAKAATTFTRGLFPSHQDPRSTLRTTADWLSGRPDAAAPLRRLVEEAHHDLTRAHLARAAHGTVT